MRKSSKRSLRAEPPNRSPGKPASAAAPPPHRRAPRPQQPALAWLAPALIALAVIIVYANSFTVPFIFDDILSIGDNPTIRSLSSLALFTPPGHGVTVSGRPLLNISLAVNYALGGENVGGYHIVNVLLHILAGLTLFGVVRRTLLMPRLRPRFGAAALPLATLIALLWVVHPLQTEAVTYIVQRAESLVSLFYLLTLYCFIRGLDAPAEGTPQRKLWPVITVITCLLGVASKEVMASAPLIVLLYDRTFAAGTFREAWRQRRGLYIGLFSTWLLLGLLIAATGGRGGTAGFSAGVSSWHYLLVQCWGVTHYLYLAFIPHPLVFDYGIDMQFNTADLYVRGALLLALVGAVVVAFKRWPTVSFAGAFFFAILTPSSSFVPVVSEALAEHRMYLPLAPVLALFATTLYAWLGRRSLPVCMLAVFVLGGLTLRRNRDYQSELALWTDNVAKQPRAARAQNNLGVALAKLKRVPEAIPHYELAMSINPKYIDAHTNMGNAMADQGRLQDAIAHYEDALRINAIDADANINYGVALLKQGRAAEALPYFETALKTKPGSAEALGNEGLALAALGRDQEALTHYQAALQSRPGYPTAEAGLGILQLKSGQTQAALGHFEQAVQNSPDDPALHAHYAAALAKANQTEQAIAHYTTALRLKPDKAETETELGLLLLNLGRPVEATGHLEHAVRLKPNDGEAENNLGSALSDGGQHQAALAHFAAALRQMPGNAKVENNFGNALVRLNQPNEALGHFSQALRSQPNFPEAENGLGVALFNLRRRAEAQQHFEAALKLKPGYADAARNLAAVKQAATNR